MQHIVLQLQPEILSTRVPKKKSYDTILLIVLFVRGPRKAVRCGTVSPLQNSWVPEYFFSYGPVLPLPQGSWHFLQLLLGIFWWLLIVVHKTEHYYFN